MKCEENEIENVKCPLVVFKVNIVEGPPVESGVTGKKGSDLFEITLPNDWALVTRARYLIEKRNGR